MQNWEHVTFILEKLHQRPTKSHGVDFSRVRLWTLDELSPFYRQSLFFSSVPMVELNALFNRACKNYVGKVSTVNVVKSGTISSVVVGGVPMTFHRVDTANLSTSVDDRFNYFVQVSLEIIVSNLFSPWPRPKCCKLSNGDCPTFGAMNAGFGLREQTSGFLLWPSCWKHALLENLSSLQLPECVGIEGESTCYL